MTQPATEVKFCRDCAHYFDDRLHAVCRAPIRKNLSLVHGTYSGRCGSMRDETGACGPDAHLFEAITDQAHPVQPGRR